MSKRNFTRAEQRMRVITQFAKWIKTEKKEVWATSYKIARALDLAPSTYFRSILSEMVMAGDLVVRERRKEGRWDALEYTLRPGTYKIPEPDKVIFRHRGKIVGQLELPLWTT